MKSKRVPCVILLSAFLALVLAPRAPCQSETLPASKQIPPAEYNALLAELNSRLPEWEQAVGRVDPARVKISYADGQKVVAWRNVALNQIAGIRVLIEKERTRRRTSQELSLRNLMASLFDVMQNILLAGPQVDVNLEQFAPRIGDFVYRLTADIQARVEMVEKGTCPE